MRKKSDIELEPASTTPIADFYKTIEPDVPDTEQTEEQFLIGLTTEKLKNFFIVLVDQLRLKTIQIEKVKSELSNRGVDLSRELKAPPDVKSNIYSKTETQKIADSMIKKRVFNNSMAKRVSKTKRTKTGN